MGGGGSQQRGRPKFFSPCFVPNTCMTPAEFFFLNKEQKERKTWWGHKMESRIRLRSTHHIDVHICCSGAAHLALSCAAALGKEAPGQRIPNTHDESELILGENLAGSLLLNATVKFLRYF